MRVFFAILFCGFVFGSSGEFYFSLMNPEEGNGRISFRADVDDFLKSK